MGTLHATDFKPGRSMARLACTGLAGTSVEWYDFFWSPYRVGISAYVAVACAVSLVSVALLKETYRVELHQEAAASL